MIHSKIKKFEKKIKQLSSNKEKLLTQLQNSKEELNKHKEEITSYKTKYAELEWENHKISREYRINNEKYQKDKEFLQQEIELLRTKKLSDVPSLRDSPIHGACEKLDVVQQDEQEIQYRQAVFDKKLLHQDILSLQKRVYELQDEHNKNQEELMTQAKNANIRVSLFTKYAHCVENTRINNKLDQKIH